MDFPLQLYDFLMLAVLMLSMIFGAWKGMAWQVAALASVVVSAGVAAHGSGALAPVFGKQEPWNRCAAMLALYIATSFGIWLAFRLVADVINRVQLKEFDRQLGAAFGALKGVVWCLVITFFAVTLSETARQTVLHCKSGYYIALVTERTALILPEEVRSVVGKYLEELDRKLDPNTPPDPKRNPSPEPKAAPLPRTADGSRDPGAVPPAALPDWTRPVLDELQKRTSDSR